MANSSRFFFVILLSTLLPALSKAQSNYPPQPLLDRITGQGIRAHMEFLADDLVEGRGTGTRGYQLAANYVRAQFAQMGLEPAGDPGSYFQKIHFRQLTPAGDRDSVVIQRGDGDHKLVFENDYLMFGNAAYPDSSVSASMVFAGFGVTAPELHYDDYAGVDAKGKIVVAVYGAPPTFPISLRAVYSDDPVKYRNAVAHGAVGIIEIWAGQQSINTPWTELVRFSHQPFMHWIDRSGTPNDYVPEIKAEAFVSQASADVLLAGSGHSFDQVMASLALGKAISFDLQGTALMHEAANFTELQSPNIAGLLRGSDPQLKNEYVVFTAHLDHVGIGDPVNGDSIYNGAVDNASGIAALLEIARAFAENQDRPRRSILFLAVAGEEAGLLGSDYYAHNPSVPIREIAANINMDGISLFYEFKDLVAQGMEHSTLSRPVQDVAHHLGLELSPDPMPEENFFIRSDQYSFVKQGVPAVAIGEGFKTVDPSLDGKKITVAWITHIYHTPQDDMNQPFNFKAARLCTQVNFAVGYEVANSTERPAWNKGDAFGIRYARH